MILSPISKGATKKTDEILSEDIINLYREKISLDVSSYFEGNKKIEIYECADTKYRFYYPPSTIGDASFYKNLGDKIGDYSRPWDFDHQFAFDKIPSGKVVLEIGCGNGEFLEKLSHEKKNEVFGLELNPDMVELCKSKKLSVSNEDLHEHAINNPGKYDVICAFQVLEHVYDINAFISSCLICLKKGGEIIFSTPNSQPFYMYYNKYETLNLPPHHIGLWNIEAYKGLLKIFNLDLIDFTYSMPISLKGVTFFKAKNLAKIKSLEGRFTNREKILLYLLVPFCMIPLFFKLMINKFNGTYIAVVFKRKV